MLPRDPGRPELVEALYRKWATGSFVPGEGLFATVREASTVSKTLLSDFEDQLIHTTTLRGSRRFTRNRSAGFVLAKPPQVLLCRWDQLRFWNRPPRNKSGDG